MRLWGWRPGPVLTRPILTRIGCARVERRARKSRIEICTGKLVNSLGMSLGVGRYRLVELRKSVEVEFVGVSFAVDFRHDVFVVVVTKGPTQLIIVHIGLILSLSPASRDLVRIDQFEFAVGSFPCNEMRILWVREQLKKELPELDLATTRVVIGPDSDGIIGV